MDVSENRGETASARQGDLPVGVWEPAATARARRVGLSLALFVAPWGFVVANTLYAWTTLHGGDDLSSRNALALAAAHPLASRVGILAAMIGSLLMLPAVLGAMKLIRVRGAWLGLVGGVLTMAAYICYFGSGFESHVTNAMARQGGPAASFVAALDIAARDPVTLWVIPLFILGNLVGTFMLGLALLRARAIPTSAAYAIMAWSVLHVLGIVVGSEWLEVTGAVLQGVGFAAVGVTLLHQPLPEDVAERHSRELVVALGWSRREFDRSAGSLSRAESPRSA